MSLEVRYKIPLRRRLRIHGWGWGCASHYCATYVYTFLIIALHHTTGCVGSDMVAYISKNIVVGFVYVCLFTNFMEYSMEHCFCFSKVFV